MLHRIERETKTEPRVYKMLQSSYPNDYDDAPPKPLFNQFVAERRAILENVAPADPGSDEEGILDSVMRYTKVHRPEEAQQVPLAGPGTERIPELIPRSSMVTEQEMMQQNRADLQKFASLKVNGESIVKTTIGGFTMDLERVARKAKEILPLPAVKLPLIFNDENLNFYHHFFQGIELLLGRDVVEAIVATEKYFEEDNILLFPLISALVGSAYALDDNDITVFTKRVISSTFEHHPAQGQSDEPKTLIVLANFWGFEYLEPGMQLKEADLKMWLSRCYDKYKIVWFNTFKSAGVPSFALSGVQNRYRAGTRYVQAQEVAIRSVVKPHREQATANDEIHTRTRRSRQSRKQQPTSFAETLFGRH